MAPKPLKPQQIAVKSVVQASETDQSKPSEIKQDSSSFGNVKFTPLFFKRFPYFIEIVVLVDHRSINVLDSLRLFKKSELIIFPGPVYASLVIKNLSSFIGLTTGKTSKSYLFAKSKSLWSVSYTHLRAHAT